MKKKVQRNCTEIWQCPLNFNRLASLKSYPPWKLKYCNTSKVKKMQTNQLWNQYQRYTLQQKQSSLFMLSCNLTKKWKSTGIYHFLVSSTQLIIFTPLCPKYYSASLCLVLLLVRYSPSERLKYQPTFKKKNICGFSTSQHMPNWNQSQRILKYHFFVSAWFLKIMYISLYIHMVFYQYGII